MLEFRKLESAVFAEIPKIVFRLSQREMERKLTAARYIRVRIQYERISQLTDTKDYISRIFFRHYFLREIELRIVNMARLLNIC